ncbi:MAG: acetate kinase, partial [Patescibacteria group bacterium]
NLVCIKKSWELFPQIDQYAIFDTAYYRTLPDYIFRYALPEKLYTEYGIRRYGFHGISHEYAALEGSKKAKINFSKAKIITCHLGSGCSMTATKDGKALSTTMGFTPLEGLMMSTRSGDIDPSIPLFLINEGLSPEEVDGILNRQSGLLGVANTRDMREILLASGEKVAGYKTEKKFSASEKEKAKLALKMFVYNIVRYAGQFKAVMKGLDLVVFTGGIGERSLALRKLVLKEIKSLGRFKSVVISANEELMIAREIKKKLK